MPRAVVVTNPGSGRSHPERPAAVAGVLAGAGWTVERVGVGDGARLEAIGTDAVMAGVDVVVAVGGDGTVAALAHALAGTEVALGIVPAGTGNVVSRNLGVPRTPVDAARLIVAGHRRRIDLGRMAGPTGEARTFVIACGVGFDAHVMRRTPPELKRRLGQPAYFLSAAALAAEIRNVDMRITADGVVHDVQAAEVLVTNMGQAMRGIRPRREIRIDDGRLDLVVVRASSPLEGLSALWEAFRHPGPEDVPGGRVRWLRIEEARIEAQIAQPVEADGDPAGRTPIAVTVAPGALSVCVPGPVDHAPR
jgi:undecaprenyl-diphosphatase